MCISKLPHLSRTEPEKWYINHNSIQLSNLNKTDEIKQTARQADQVPAVKVGSPDGGPWKLAACDNSAPTNLHRS